MTSKKSITRNWLKTEAPKKEVWTEVMHNMFMMEMLTLTGRLELGKFTFFWKNWVDFVSALRSDLVA